MNRNSSFRFWDIRIRISRKNFDDLLLLPLETRRQKILEKENPNKCVKLILPDNNFDLEWQIPEPGVPVTEKHELSIPRQALFCPRPLPSNKAHYLVNKSGSCIIRSMKTVNGRQLHHIKAHDLSFPANL